MHIGNRSLLWVAPLAAAGIGIGAAPALAAHASQSRPAATAKRAVTDKITIYVFKKDEKIPGAIDKKYHDEMVPSTWAIRAGVKTQVTVVNYDDGDHSITAPALHLNAVIKPATAFKKPPAGATPPEIANGTIPRTTTFTLTVNKSGSYQWHCAMPCDGGPTSFAMTSSNDFGMSGYIVVV